MKKIASVFMVLLIVSAASVKTYAQISIGVSVNIAPPVLPTYTQPPCPVDGYLWTPGYWAYDQDGGYYWVPGVWVSPPRVGYLWTPGYWGYDGAVYVFHEGYWGPHIGFYGGVNYGYGYVGTGYVGGRWAGNSFQYNTAVVNVNKTVVHNTYINKTVINNNVTVNNNSFNGPGGVTAKPQPQEQAAEKENHIQPTADQITHRQVAIKDPSQFAKNNNGHPATAAMNKVNGSRFTPEGSRAQPSVRANAAANPAHAGNAEPSADNSANSHSPARRTNVAAVNNGAARAAAQHSNRAPRRQALAPREERPHRERQR
jgi:hypothetical protein